MMDCDEFCARYAHAHCANCGEILPAIGGGGDDGRGIDGYEDQEGHTARTCTDCREDMLCAKCAAQDSRCPDCRADRVVAV